MHDVHEYHNFRYINSYLVSLSALQKNRISNNPSSLIQNGDQIDLSSYPDHVYKIKLSNSTILNPIKFFQNLVIRFIVRPPKDHGVIVVIQEMHLRRPASRLPSVSDLDCRADYIKVRCGAQILLITF
jgi:hypothetical protein